MGFLALTLSGAVKAAFYCAWFQAEKCGGSNVGAGPYFPWHAYCGSSVPGALGFVGFLTLTLSRAVNAAFVSGWGGHDLGAVKEKGVEGAVLEQCCASFGLPL